MDLLFWISDEHLAANGYIHGNEDANLRGKPFLDGYL